MLMILSCYYLHCVSFINCYARWVTVYECLSLPSPLHSIRRGSKNVDTTPCRLLSCIIIVGQDAVT